MATLVLYDDVKMVRETLAVAEHYVRITTGDRNVEHAARMGRLIEACDQARPLGPDGTHGNLHTLVCGCEDAPLTRDRVLEVAGDIINGQRAHDYGDATESFSRIAALWSAVLAVEVTPAQVALCLLQLKVSRLCVTPTHEDSWIDAAGYVALGGEIAAKAVR